MHVLVTGSQGFIGLNLIERLNQFEGIHISTFNKEDKEEILEQKVQEADFIFHLAGINRPEDAKEFYIGNRDLTKKVVKFAEESAKKTPILITSSTQAAFDNDYGKSKQASEILLETYAQENDTVVYIYRLPNVFGKWSKPNYNTVIATWCHNITRDIPIQINDSSVELTLVYIDDVVEHFTKHLDEKRQRTIVRPEVSPVYKKTLTEIQELLTAFKKSRVNLTLPRVGRGFERALYATYLSFLPTDKFSYELHGHVDNRGTFYEFVRTLDSGQFSISTTMPGITRGSHYHNSKNEKFVVVKGEATIKHRQIHGDEIIEYKVSDKKIEVVEMIPGYTHNIANTGDTEMILLIWANESFDNENPDTYFLEV